MSQQLINAIRAQAALSDGKMIVRIGQVSEYATDTYSARVKIQPENMETGFLPIWSPWIGNGWGMFCPPADALTTPPGDSVIVLFQEGDSGAGIIIGGLFNDSDRPLPVPMGEFWLVHKTNSKIQLLNTGDVNVVSNRDETHAVGRNLNVTVAGNVTLNVSGNANIAVTGTMTSNAAQWNHTGPIAITGTVTATGDGVFAGTSVHTHVHSGVVSGPSNTGAPV